MTILLTAVRLVLAILAIRGVRWAFLLFIVFGLAYFPAKAGFKLDPHACERALSPELIRLSMTKWAHVVLFGLFFLVSFFHFRASHWATQSSLGMAVLLTIVMGALVEIAEGVTGTGNCRVRDLVPDALGAC